MNKFIITNFEHRTVAEQNQSYMTSIENPFGINHVSFDQHLSCELILRPVEINDETLRKLYNIHKNGRTLTLNDSDYANFMEPFKEEFIHFMMNKHPDKILANPESWDNLVGK